jgi:hypothetical protein
MIDFRGVGVEVGIVVLLIAFGLKPIAENRADAARGRSDRSRREPDGVVVSLHAARIHQRGQASSIGQAIARDRAEAPEAKRAPIARQSDTRGDGRRSDRQRIGRQNIHGSRIDRHRGPRRQRSRGVLGRGVAASLPHKRGSAVGQHGVAGSSP